MDASLNPEISVVLSTIAVDAWLRHAVRSILDQTGVTLELVLVFDGVEPQLVEDEAKFLGSDERVKIVKLDHRSGLAAALRRGIAASEAPLVARLDADDVALPGRLARQKQYLDAHESCVLVGSAAQLIDPNGNLVGQNSPASGDDVRYKMTQRNQIIHPSAMFRRSVYDLTSGYNPRLPRMQDYDLWLRMANHGQVAVLSDPLIQYRVHPGQSSRRARPRGEHIDSINRGQRELAMLVGRSRISVALGIAVWRVTQYARYLGVLRPGYDRMISKSAGRPGRREVHK